MNSPIKPRKPYKLEENAVKQAFINNSSLIVTDNLDAAFRETIANKNDTNYYLKNINVNTQSRVKRASLGKRSAFSIDRVFDVPHNPFRNRLAIETPQNFSDLYQRFRYYVQREPLVGAAIELHSEYPLSQFELSHEDPGLREEFNDIAEDLNLFELMLDMTYEYFAIGETFVFGIFDDHKDPSVWKSFVLLNPLNISINHTPITDGRPNSTFSLKVDKQTSDVVIKGKYSGNQSNALYDRIPQDVKNAIMSSDGWMPLNEMQVSHFKRKGNYFKVRGESLIYRILHLLAYRDRIRDGQLAIIDRNATSRELWKVGSPDNPASPDEINEIADLVQQSYLDPSQAIVWHDAVSVDVIGGSEKVLPLRQEMDQIEEEIYIGLMLNKGFLDSSYGAYANTSVALDILISRYLTYRQRIERWQRDHVWAPLCRIHNIYKPTQAELEHRIRVKNKKKKPWTPKVSWHKQELRDNTQKVQLYMSIREKLFGKGMPGFPATKIYEAINENPATIKKMLQKEERDMQIQNKLDVNVKGPAGGPLDLGVDVGGLEAPIGAIPEGAGGELPATGEPTSTDLGEGVTIQPPESSEVSEGFGTGT